MRRRAARALPRPRMSRKLSAPSKHNGAKRTEGVKMAVQLGTETLPDLHELMGHGRREVRNAAAAALGRIGDAASIPFLVAGLQGNSQNVSKFRPTVDTAAEALGRYAVEPRTALLAGLEQQVLPKQVMTLVRGFDTEAAFAAVRALDRRGLLLLDWSETVLELLVAIDPVAAWPLVQRDLPSLSGWSLFRLLPGPIAEHQLDAARDWMRSGRGDSGTGIEWSLRSARSRRPMSS